METRAPFAFLHRIEYKWLVAAVFVVALFVDYLDTTVVNVALPTLGAEFGAGATSIEWVVTGYLLSLAVFIPISGWAGDRFGAKRTFLFALALFTAASALCALAWNLESLVAFRVLQGIGGGLMTPVGAAMLYRAFPPEERARAVTAVTIPTVIGPTSGPLIGGYLVEYQSWHWIFLLNVPVGLLGLLFAWRVLREQRQPDAGRLDVPGFLLAAAGLAALLYGLAQAGTRGLGDPQSLGPGLAGLALLAAFALVESRTAKPLIDLSLFRDRLFLAGNVLIFFTQAVFIGVIFMLPLLFQAELGLDPLRSGLVTFPTALGVLMVTPLTNRLYSRIGPRRLVAAGMLLSVASSLALRTIGEGTSEGWSRALMLPRGWAFGLAVIPLQAVAYATISSAQTGRATAAFTAVRQIAGSFGVALLATVLSRRLTDHGARLGDPASRAAAISAFHDTFLVAAALGLVGLAATLLVNDRLAAHTRRRTDAAPVKQPASEPATAPVVAD